MKSIDSLFLKFKTFMRCYNLWCGIIAISLLFTRVGRSSSLQTKLSMSGPGIVIREVLGTFFSAICNLIIKTESTPEWKTQS
jgi:hypothetical protein